MRSLSVGFEATTVLKGLNFDVFERETLVLMGPAGVGKSTLLRTLARYNEPLPAFWAHGSIDFRGRDLLRTWPVQEARRRVALLAQKARLFTATVGDNAIALAREQQTLSHQEKRELLREVLHRCGIWERLCKRLDQPVTSLSIAEQRMLSMARLLGGGACCLIADEPFRDIAEAEYEDLAQFFERLASHCTVIMSTHHQGEARRLADRVCLLAAGQIVELCAGETFFREPRSELARAFLRSGNCWPGRADADAKQGLQASLEPDAPPAVAAAAGDRHPSWQPTAEESRPRPGGFHWIIPQRLGGTQWPGLIREESEDVTALAALGVRHLVSLTEQPFSPDALLAHGIAGDHWPISDMGVPALQSAREWCARLARWIELGEPVVLHCKAGLGRTGTVLACALVYMGSGHVRAIHEVRQVNRYYIQSKEQLEFVPRFWCFLRGESP